MGGLETTIYENDDQWRARQAENDRARAEQAAWEAERRAHDALRRADDAQARANYSMPAPHIPGVPQEFMQLIVNLMVLIFRLARAMLDGSMRRKRPIVFWITTVLVGLTILDSLFGRH